MCTTMVALSKVGSQVAGKTGNLPLKACSPCTTLVLIIVHCEP